MFRIVLVSLASLVLFSSLYANDEGLYDRSLRSRTHHITLSRIVGLQQMIDQGYLADDDDSPVNEGSLAPFAGRIAPPNTPVTPVRAIDTTMDSCFRGVTKLIVALSTAAIRIITALNR